MATEEGVNRLLEELGEAIKSAGRHREIVQRWTNTCNECGEDYPEGSGGWDGKCADCADNDWMIEEEDFDTEPVPDDYILEPCGSLGSQTAVVIYERGTWGVFDSNDAALDALRKKISSEGFHPNIWWCSDHGNMWQIDQEGNEIK